MVVRDSNVIVTSMVLAWLLYCSNIAVVEGFCFGRVSICKRIYVNYAVRKTNYLPACDNTGMCLFGKPKKIDSEISSRESLANEFTINENIIAESVRLMLPILEDADTDTNSTIIGNSIEGIRRQGGVMPILEAIELAKKLNFDLILINDKGVPPVCKIADVGKYKYFLEKKKKDRDKKLVHQVVKEVKLSCTINQHDIDIRIRAAKEYMAAGDKVKFSVDFKGRENKHPEIGLEVLKRVLAQFGASSFVVEEAPRQDGKSMYMVLKPKKT